MTTSMETPSPHPHRRELELRWRDFLGGVVDEATTREYIDFRIADYGPEELVHSGLLLLNDDLLDRQRGLPPSTVRFERWALEVNAYDENPALWNRRWATQFIERLEGRISPTNLRMMQDQIRKELGLVDDEKVEELPG